MQLLIAAVGSRMSSWVDTAFADYAGRMPPELKLVLKEVRPEPRTAGRTVESMMEAEADRLRTALPKQATRIALDEHGRDLTSVDLSALITRWRGDGDDVCFLIGGPDGLDPALKAEAGMRIRLSSLTLPHGMARVLLAEQLYRAWSITQHHPYHRA